MSGYPFSQLIREIFIQVQGWLAKPYIHMASRLNAEIDKNFLTRMGGATIDNFFVAPLQRRVYAFILASRNLGYSRSLQLGKEGN